MGGLFLERAADCKNVLAIEVRRLMRARFQVTPEQGVLPRQRVIHLADRHILALAGGPGESDLAARIARLGEQRMGHQV